MYAARMHDHHTVGVCHVVLVAPMRPGAFRSTCSPASRTVVICVEPSMQARENGANVSGAEFQLAVALRPTQPQAINKHNTPTRAPSHARFARAHIT